MFSLGKGKFWGERPLLSSFLVFPILFVQAERCLRKWHFGVRVAEVGPMSGFSECVQVG